MARKHKDFGYVDFQYDYNNSEPFSYTELIYPEYDNPNKELIYGMDEQELYEYYEELSDEELMATIKNDISFLAVSKVFCCFFELIIATLVCSAVSISLLNNYFYSSDINIPNNITMKNFLNPSIEFVERLDLY